GRPAGSTPPDSRRGSSAGDAEAVPRRARRLAPALEERCEGPGVEVHTDLGDLSVLDAVPLGGRGIRHRAGLEVVDDAHVVAVDEQLLLLGTGHDLAEALERLQVGLGAVELVDRPLEAQIVVQQLARALEVLVRPRGEELLRNLLCVGHWPPPRSLPCALTVCARRLPVNG